MMMIIMMRTRMVREFETFINRHGCYCSNEAHADLSCFPTWLGKGVFPARQEWQGREQVMVRVVRVVGGGRA